MKIIAHRGNIEGPSFDENSPTLIDSTIKSGFDVEIDLWKDDAHLLLGHDEPTYEISPKWIKDRLSNIWVHCKNLEAAHYCSTMGYDIRYFWHQEDDFTLTSNGYFWTFPGKPLCSNSIAVMPETTGDIPTDIYAICTDYPIKYKKIYKL